MTTQIVNDNYLCAGIKILQIYMCDFFGGGYLYERYIVLKLIHKNQSNKKGIDALVLQHFSMRLSV